MTAAFSSIDNLIKKMTGGSANATPQTNEYWFSKVANSANLSSADWWCPWVNVGNPSAGVLTGAAGTAVSMDSTLSGAIPLLEGNVSPATRQIINAWWNSSSGGSSNQIGRAQLWLCDFLAYYPSCVLTGSPSTLTSLGALPRYANGIGVQAISVVQTTLGATVPAITVTYTDNTNGSQSATWTAQHATQNVNSMLQNSNGSGYLNVGNAKAGIKKLDSYTIGTTATGTVAFMLIYPLLSIPIFAQQSTAERDLIYQLDNLPAILDGACLGFVGTSVNNPNASSTLNGGIKYVWGP